MWFVGFRREGRCHHVVDRVAVDNGFTADHRERGGRGEDRGQCEVRDALGRRRRQDALHADRRVGRRGRAAPASAATFWPPLLLPAGTTAATGVSGVTGLGTTEGAGGTQVTKDGLPLYRFAADAAAGDANGEGVSSFGGTWHVVKTAAVSSSGSTQTTAAPAPTATTVDPYGY